MRFLRCLAELQAGRRARPSDLQTAAGKAGVDEPMDATRAVIAESEEMRAQLSRLSHELAEYVADLRALTLTLATVHQQERPDPGHGAAQS